MIGKTYLRSLFAFSIGLILLAGCGPSRPPMAPVHGRVTYQGKPVAEGTIIFHPENGRQSIGEIAPDGTYSLTTFDPGDGALLGRHTVTIEARRITETFLPDGAYGPPKIEWLLPQKFSISGSSNLTAEVEKGDNKIDFDL